MANFFQRMLGATEEPKQAKPQAQKKTEQAARPKSSTKTETTSRPSPSPDKPRSGTSRPEPTTEQRPKSPTMQKFQEELNSGDRARGATEDYNPWTDSDQAEGWKALGDSLVREPSTTLSKGGPVNSDQGIGRSWALTRPRVERKAPKPRPGLGSFNVEHQTMEYDDVLGLSDRRQAAIEFNTLLRDAVAADANDYNSDLATDEDYTARMEAMFGKKRGSERYAPRTMALLESLGLTDLESDFDEYLDGRGYIDDQSVAALEYSGGDGATRRQSHARAITDAMSSQISSALQRGQSVLDGLQARDSDLFGAARVNIPDEAAPWLDALFNASQSSTIDAEKFASMVYDIENELGVSSATTANYLDNRLRALTRDIKGGRATTADGFLSPEEIRAKFLTPGGA